MISSKENRSCGLTFIIFSIVLLMFLAFSLFKLRAINLNILPKTKTSVKNPNMPSYKYSGGKLSVFKSEKRSTSGA